MTDKAMVKLVAMYRQHHNNITELDSEDIESDAIMWMMEEVWALRAEIRELRIATWAFQPKT